MMKQEKQLDREHRAKAESKPELNLELEHAALVINDLKEVEHFYQDMLGMEKVRDFTLSRELAGKIFGIDRETRVFQLYKGKIILELFHASCPVKQYFQHLCISMERREAFLERIRRDGYDCVRMKRTGPDLVFVRDKSGNIFEIKEKLTERQS